jgi:hypothetical protein
MKAFVLAAALLAVGSIPSSAQQHGAVNDGFAGYSMLASDGQTMHGGHLSVAWGVWGPSLGIVLDAARHQGNDAGGTEVSLLSVMAGPRATFGGGRLRPFLHVIAGVVRTRASVSIFDVEISESSTGLGGAAGGGVDVGFGERWAIRLGSDYRMVRHDEQTLSDPRFSAGIVHRFGTR